MDGAAGSASRWRPPPHQERKGPATSPHTGDKVQCGLSRCLTFSIVLTAEQTESDLGAYVAAGAVAPRHDEESVKGAT